MAKALIESMSAEWQPDKYVDEYKVALEKMIEEKIEHGDQMPQKPAHRPKATKVIDLVSVLQQSLAQTGERKPKGKSAKGEKTRRTPHKKAA